MRKLNKGKFRIEEVIAYLEEKIIEGSSTQIQDEWYADYTSSGKFTRDKVLRGLLDEMHQFYNGEVAY
ncbi:hypothetical protein ACI2JA_04000 [Alkalihalobacillus sp. NPDC078783]